VQVAVLSLCPQSVAIHQYLHEGFIFLVFYSAAIYTRSFFQSRLGRADTAALLLSTSSRHLDGRANDRFFD
jgi:uncharacterized protein YllA (UPF0747 family)